MERPDNEIRGPRPRNPRGERVGAAGEDDRVRSVLGAVRTSPGVTGEHLELAQRGEAVLPARVGRVVDVRPQHCAHLNPAYLHRFVTGEIHGDLLARYGSG